MATTRAKAKSHSADDFENCIFCDSSIERKTPAVKCDMCSNWVCLPCSKLPLSMYNEMTKCDEDDAFEWKCKSCKSLKGDLKSIHKTLLDLKHDNDTRLNKVESTLADFSENMKSKVSEEVEKVKASISKSVAEDIATTVKEIVQTQLKEIEERKNRSTNLIIFNIPLSTAKDPKERNDSDVSILNDLFKALCPDKGDLQIRTCFRLINRKKRKQNATEAETATTPPLKAILNSKEQRRHMLLNSKNISDLSDSALKELIVVRDLTHEQRKETSALQQEKRDRVAAGENVVIRNRKVVTAPPSSDFRG